MPLMFKNTIHDTDVEPDTSNRICHTVVVAYVDSQSREATEVFQTFVDWPIINDLGPLIECLDQIYSGTFNAAPPDSIAETAAKLFAQCAKENVPALLASAKLAAEVIVAEAADSNIALIAVIDDNDSITVGLHTNEQANRFRALDADGVAQ